MWQQVYDPMGNPFISTALAATPVVVLLAALGIFRIKAHWAAIAALIVALAISISVFHMPAGMAGKTAFLGILTGLLPIGWIILNVIFLYKLSEETGRFKVLQDKGPTYFYTSDPKGQAQVREKLELSGPYASLLVVYRGSAEADNGNTVTVTLGGHYVGGEHDGRVAEDRAIAVRCDTTGWRLVSPTVPPADTTLPPQADAPVP